MRLPFCVVFDQGVEDDQEFASSGQERLHFGFARLNESTIVATKAASELGRYAPGCFSKSLASSDVWANHRH
jgi:hypothetical protein